MKQTKEEILSKLNKVAKPATTWLDEAQYRTENYDDIKKAQKIALIVLRTLRSRNMSQVALAHKLGTTPQLVNKWLKGKENFTLSTIEKLENALDIKLVEIAVAKPEIKIFRAVQWTVETSCFEKREVFTVPYTMAVVKSEKTPVTRGLTRTRIPLQELCQA